MNSEKLDSVEKIPGLYNDLRNSSLVELRLRRDGIERVVIDLIR